MINRKTTVEKAEAIFNTKSTKMSDETRQAARIAQSKGWRTWKIDKSGGRRKVIKV